MLKGRTTTWAKYINGQHGMISAYAVYRNKNVRVKGVMEQKIKIEVSVVF
jgi:hypothetical protein